MKIQFKISKLFEEEKFKDGTVMTPFCVEGLMFDRYHEAVFRYKGQIPKNQKTIVGDLYYWFDDKLGKSVLHLGRFELD